MSDEPAKPKLIVDDDWKERVQAEKEAAQKQAQQKPQPATDADSTQPAADGTPQEIPPASFALLLTSLATQALAAMGQIPDPDSQQPLIRLDLARHHIDTISILEEKTKGNLSPDEGAMMTSLLHELRMLFVSVQGASAQGASAQGASAAQKNHPVEE